MSRLETFTHVVIIIFCCVAGALLLENRFGNRALVPPRIPGAATSAARSVEFAQDVWSVHPRTVVVGLRSTCPHCEKSLAFYRQMFSVARRSGSEAAIVVVSPEDPEIVRGFLSRSGLSADKIYKSELTKLGILYTPTVLVINSRGTIESEFVGELPEVSAQRLLASISKASDPTRAGH
jgi:hypothetical protein